MGERKEKITIPQRMACATVGGILTSLLVTPFDVVKNRLQAQTNVAVAHVCDVPASCTHYKVCN